MSAVPVNPSQISTRSGSDRKGDCSFSSSQYFSFLIPLLLSQLSHHPLPWSPCWSPSLLPCTFLCLALKHTGTVPVHPEGLAAQRSELKWGTLLFPYWTRFFCNTVHSNTPRRSRDSNQNSAVAFRFQFKPSVQLTLAQIYHRIYWWVLPGHSGRKMLTVVSLTMHHSNPTDPNQPVLARAQENSMREEI